VPQEFFDLYPRGGQYAPPINHNDLDDILNPRGAPKFKPSADYLWLKQNDMFDEAARAYLAGVSYADACLGAIFEGLRNSPHYDNTIVIVWGDHGWHLGEKLRYRKAAGWSESTRIPLLVRLPGMTRRQDCQRPVSMIDFYPTLIELAGLPEKPALDGRSFAPLLADPKRPWDRPVVTIHGEGNASITDERWRYIRYADGTEEFYDLASDPQEWNNLVTQMTGERTAAKKRLAALMPKSFAKGIESKIGQRVSGLDESIKPGRPLSKLK
jgi:arylsulfatase A-like enzyme